MNDAAAEALGFPHSDLGLAGVDAADLQRLLLGGGIVRDGSGALFAPGYSHELSPHHHTDLTGVECRGARVPGGIRIRTDVVR